MAEIWDLFDDNRDMTGETLERGDKMPEGRYHIIVDIWTITPDGKFIIDQRHPDKANGLMWECTGGSVQAGETSLQGAARELQEELGITVLSEELNLIDTVKVEERFVDTYVLFRNIKVEDLKLQDIEVVDAKLVTYEELEELHKTGNLCPRERFLHYKDKLKECVEYARR